MPLRRIYKIISLELEDTSKELTLYMAIKDRDKLGVKLNNLKNILI